VIRTDSLDYPLPPERIAQTPAERRDASRLLVVDRASRSVSHRVFSDLPQYLQGGDILFRNTASVLAARLAGRKPTGGSVECLVLRRTGGHPGDESWRCMVRPGRRLPAGATFTAAGDALSATVVSQDADGTCVVRFITRSGESVEEVANRQGGVPLPPYITRADETMRERDRERYQTVYADRGRQVAVAAPTAGLHFTPALLARIGAMGVRAADLTLHVGLGTFRPIATETVEAHPIHSEVYEIPAVTQRLLFPPLSGRRIAVGTTTVRSVEDFLEGNQSPLGHDHVAEASLYIYPPRQFRGVDALVTNFHQPRSTLLCLVAAFLTPGSTEGLAWLMDLYAEALKEGYRFLSYGDAMLVL
jgi:S-adenosylmethionine:tRNA ribosyltransferase-isomerase